MAHIENVKTVDAISKHLGIEDEHKKSLAPSHVALVAKGSKPKCKRPFRGKQAKKVNAPLKTCDLGKALPRSKRLRAMERRI